MSKRIGKWVKVYLDDSGGTAREITNDVASINGLPLTYGKVEVGGSEEDMNYLIGRGDSEVTLGVKFNPTATTGSHTVISGIVGGNTARTLTIQIGANATPTTGDPEFEGEVLCHTYNPVPDLNADVAGEAVFVPAVGNTLPAWGTV